MKGPSIAVLVATLAVGIPAPARAETATSNPAASGTTEVTVRMIDSERTVTPGGLPASGDQTGPVVAFFSSLGVFLMLAGAASRRRRTSD